MKSENARPEPAKPAKPSFKQLSARFQCHQHEGEKAPSYVAVQLALLNAASACVEHTPASPEQTDALKALDQAMFLFNAAIARHG